MIRRPLSLKTSIALAFLSLGIVIVIGYSLLSVSFFFRGMDSIVSANMEKALQSYVETISEAQQQHLNEFSGYSISRYWNQQPGEIQFIFQRPPQELGNLQIHKDAPIFSRPNVIYFLITLETNGQRFFISHKGTREEASPLIGKNAHESKRLLYGISLAITVLLMLIIWLLVRKVSQPIANLTTWTHSLTPASLKQAPPDFLYPELNEMAALIRNSLSSVNDSLQREHDFLRFTSHELRTPISVIRNNIQLARKLEQSPSIDASGKKADIMDRIDRASLTMQHLSETLLWLSRDDVEALPTRICQLDELINSIVEELHYLLSNKQVEVTVELTPYDIDLPPVAARIVIGNLIRNAFQHTWQGVVVITQQQNQITIHNQCEQSQADDIANDQGFGLGLRLTEALCQKLHWHYHNHHHANGHDVTLLINSSQGYQHKPTL